MLDLPSASGATSLTFSNAAGDLLHTMQLGAQPSGLVGFEWSDVPQSVLDSGEGGSHRGIRRYGQGHGEPDPEHLRRNSGGIHR